jgi:hypothetical protein
MGDGACSSDDKNSMVFFTDSYFMAGLDGSVKLFFFLFVNVPSFPLHIVLLLLLLADGT